MAFLERRFQLGRRGTKPRTEVLGGTATFLTMSYILFVNPAILSAAGMPFNAVAVATVRAAGVRTDLAPPPAPDGATDALPSGG